jgi:hypothetical protein
MAAYQLRLAEETKEKISHLEVNGRSDLKKIGARVLKDVKRLGHRRHS